jgi:hypothetical protein
LRLEGQLPLQCSGVPSPSASVSALPQPHWPRSDVMGSAEQLLDSIFYVYD